MLRRGWVLRKKKYFCKGGILEGTMGVLLVSAGNLDLFCKKGLVRDVKKRGLILSCKDGLALRAESGGRTKKVEVGSGDCASGTG